MKMEPGDALMIIFQFIIIIIVGAIVAGMVASIGYVALSLAENNWHFSQWSEASHKMASSCAVLAGIIALVIMYWMVRALLSE